MSDEHGRFGRGETPDGRDHGCHQHMLSTATTTDQPSAPGDMGPSGDIDLSEEEIFDVLSNRRRRFVIHALKHAKEQGERGLGVSELSTRVAAWELDIEPEEVTYDDRRNVHSTLRRTHLPNLESNHIITIDEETDLVRPTPALEELEIYVEVLRGKEIPWSLYYVGLAAAVSSVLLATYAGVPGFASLSALNVGVFAVTAFGVSSVVHHAIGRHGRLGNHEKPPELRRGT